MGSRRDSVRSVGRFGEQASRGLRAEGEERGVKKAKKCGGGGKDCASGGEADNGLIHNRRRNRNRPNSRSLKRLRKGKEEEGGREVLEFHNTS